MKKNLKLTAEIILNLVAKKGFPIDISVNSINIVGIRNPKNTGAFADKMAIIYEKDGMQNIAIYEAETDYDGSGSLVPGHYPNCWSMGAYNGEYMSLVSASNAALNLCCRLHDKYTLKNRVWKGTDQIIKHSDDFHALLGIVINAADKPSPYFSYTLIEGLDAA